MHTITAAALLCSMATQAENPGNYYQLYQQTGLDQQMLSLWTQIDAEYQGLQKKAARVTPDQKESVSSLIKFQFSEPALRESIVSAWQQRLAQSDIEHISLWLNSDTGKTITQAEIAASFSPESEFTRYLSTLKIEPPSKARIQLLRQLDKAVQASAASTDLGIYINLAAYSARFSAGLAPMNALLPAQKALSHEQDRTLIQALIQQDILRYSLFSYRSISDDSLRAYIAFANSPSGKRFHASTFLATQAAMRDATQKLQTTLEEQSHRALLPATRE